MSLDCLNEAFKKLDALTEETFNTSSVGINDLSSFLDKDDANDLVKIIDPEAESEEDLQDSYIGKVIINCNVCHSNIFKHKEDIVIDTDGVVNIDEQCLYCGEESGFSVIGEIKPFEASTEESENTPEEESEPTVTTDSDDSIDSDEPAVEEEESIEVEKEVVEESLQTLTLEEKGHQWKPHTRKLMALLGLDDEEGDISEGLFGHKESPEEAKYHAALQKVLTQQVQKESIIKRCPEIKSVEFTDDGEVIIKTDITGTIKFYTEVENPDEDDLLLDAEQIISEIPAKYVESVEEDDESKDDLIESVNNVNVETDDSIVNVHTEEDGKVVVSTEPKVSETGVATEGTEEMIAPLSDETQASIEDENGFNELEGEDTPEDLEVDLDIEEIDEEGLDELGESYLTRVFENVQSFKTTKVGTSDTKLVVEGLITFTSGKQKKTGFIFEAHSMNQQGILKFVGENKHLNESKKAFTLTASYKDKKLLPESLSYRFTSSDNKIKFGKVRRKK